MEKENVLYKEVEEEIEQFESDNARNLSKIESLRQLEINFKQTIALSNDEKRNPSAVIPFLNKLKTRYYLELDTPESKEFFAPSPESFSFDQILDDMLMERDLEKARMKCFVYLVLLKRKSMTYNQQYFDGLSKNHAFHLKDIYYLKEIHSKCFNDLKMIPSGIIKRCQASPEDYEMLVDKYVRQYEKLDNKVIALSHAMEYEATNEDSSATERDKQIKRLKSEMKATEKAIDELSASIKADVIKKERLPEPNVKDIASFIGDFINCALSVDAHHFNDEMNVKTHEGIQYTDNTMLINNATLDKLYFQDTKGMVWVSPNQAILDAIWTMTDVKNFTTANKTNILDATLDVIKSKSRINLITFKQDAIFTKNGVILLDIDKGKLKTHTFVRNRDLTMKDIMFKYPTYYRSDLIYNPNAPFNTEYYQHGDRFDIDPTFIFEALGRRGFETYESMSDEDKRYFDNEAEHRANLLKQFALNTLVFHNDIPGMQDVFLYLYNAAGSGKTTFMKLVSNMVGKKASASIDMDDLDSKRNPFGLINVKDKFIVSIDEVTDGKHELTTKTLKKLTTKGEVNANQKNKDYVPFTPTASYILASNYAPKFSDESGGTERRLLAFQLASGYTERGNNQNMSFIRDELINQSNFLSACLTHILNTVDLSSGIPQSVIDDGTEIISKEDEIHEFIEDKLRHAITEPLFINEKDLYEFYKIEMATQGRSQTKIRNKENFIKGLDKLKRSVFTFKQGYMHNVQMINKLLWLEGELFYEDISNQNNNELDKLIAKHFTTLINKRKRALDKWYDDVLEYNDPNCNRTISKVGLTRQNVYVILPNTEIYADYHRGNDSELFKDLATNQRNTFNKKFVNKENIKIIKDAYDETYEGSGDINRIKNIYKNLPFTIDKHVNSSFNAYKNDTSFLDDYHRFFDFL